MIKIKDLKPFDMAEMLDTEEDIKNYLNIVMEEGDASELAHALGVIAKARGMTQIAKDTGICRESLYKALREGAEPRYETISKVINAFGLKLVVVPE
ncbi:MAG: putative addiction module antidote protein [Pelistega sp.]|nr:putative addiction module antidote protein [Pelistega sp.]